MDSDDELRFASIIYKLNAQGLALDDLQHRLAAVADQAGRQRPPLPSGASGGIEVGYVTVACNPMVANDNTVRSGRYTPCYLADPDPVTNPPTAVFTSQGFPDESFFDPLGTLAPVGVRGYFFKQAGKRIILGWDCSGVAAPAPAPPPQPTTGA